MVYNAMKLFMEINPQLFDDCSHQYTEQQNSAASREAIRQRKWSAIAEQADRRKGVNGNASHRPRTNTMPRVDEADGTEDNQKRLDSLKLQDGDRRERRPTNERQNSVGSSRSQR
jgi:serine/threonine-protein phosphatase 2A regulatory subunit B'